jgi:hypothetical protein
MKRTAVLAASLCLAVAVSGASQVPDVLDRIRPETIRAHMTFLADDLLEGRGTGAHGFELAAKYAAAQFAGAGLQPAGEDGGYYQRVRFRRTRVIPEQSSLAIVQPATSEPLEWDRDFVVLGNMAQSPSATTAPVRFVGYGISAPEHGLDDYASDVRGAIVAFLPGVPPEIPAHRRDYYTSVKRQLAQERGAVATIELSTPDADKVWSWEDRVSAAADGTATWLDAGGAPPADRRVARVLLSSAGTSRLLGATSRTIEEVLAAPKPIGLAAAVLRLATRDEEIAAPHTLAMLPGSDARLRNEYVLYIAHLDGQGRGKTVGGDDIYNSAIDNGLGSAILLTLAQTFAGLAARPKRSLLFLAATGEELGVAGSPYFVENPTVPLDRIVAVINIDGPSLLTDAVRSVLAMGAENSTLGVVADRAARQLGLDVKPSTAPLNFSDHFPFVMKGIPALWIVGEDDAAESKEAREAARRNVHTPKDDMNRTFRWDAAVALARLNFLIGREVANERDRPRWNRFDILGVKFGKRPAR